MEAYCSVDALEESAEEPPGVFSQGCEAATAAVFTSGTSTCIIWLHDAEQHLMLIDCDLIFSGALRPYLIQDDLELLKQYMKELSSFPFYEPRLRNGSERPVCCCCRSFSVSRS